MLPTFLFSSFFLYTCTSFLLSLPSLPSLFHSFFFLFSRAPHLRVLTISYPFSKAHNPDAFLAKVCVGKTKRILLQEISLPFSVTLPVFPFSLHSSLFLISPLTSLLFFCYLLFFLSLFLLLFSISLSLSFFFFFLLPFCLEGDLVSLFVIACCGYRYRYARDGISSSSSSSCFVYTLPRMSRAVLLALLPCYCWSQPLPEGH